MESIENREKRLRVKAASVRKHSNATNVNEILADLYDELADFVNPPIDFDDFHNVTEEVVTLVNVQSDGPFPRSAATIASDGSVLLEPKPVVASRGEAVIASDGSVVVKTVPPVRVRNRRRVTPIVE